MGALNAKISGASLLGKKALRGGVLKGFVSKFVIGLLLVLIGSNIVFCRSLEDVAFSAVISGDLSELKQAVSDGFDVNTPFGSGAGKRLPLHLAIDFANRYGNDRLEIVEFLIAKGADVNAKDIERLRERTPLISAVTTGARAETAGNDRDLQIYKQIAGLLVAHGANVDAKDDGGDSPLVWSILVGSKSMVAFLVFHCAALDNDAAKLKEALNRLFITSSKDKDVIATLLKSDRNRRQCATRR